MSSWRVRKKRFVLHKRTESVIGSEKILMDGAR